MPLVDHSPEDRFGGFTPPEPLDRPTPGFLEVLGAAARLENDVVAAHELLTQPKYTDDPNFDLISKMKKDGYWESPHWRSFLGVRSDAEYLDIARELETELKDRETLAAAGWPGILAGIGAGLLSPVSILPLTTGARGLKAVGQGALYATMGAGIQEGALLATQETRTAKEALLGISTATVLGGVLGGAVGMFGRRALDDIVYEMSRIDAQTVGRAAAASDNIETRLAPGRGEWRFTSFAETPRTYRGGVQIFESDTVGDIPQQTYRFSPQAMLVVTPESRQAIAQTMGVDEPTLDRIIDWAKENEFDAIATRDLEETPNQVIVFDKDTLQAEAISNETSPFPSFGSGVEEVVAARNIESSNAAGYVGAVDLSAAAAQTPVGGVWRQERGVGGAALRFLARIGPVTRVLSQQTDSASRFMMSRLSNAGLQVADPQGRVIPISGVGPLGIHYSNTVENAVKSWYGGYAKYVEDFEEIYGDYLSELPVAQRLLVSRGLSDQKLSRHAFRVEVTRAMRNRDEHEIEHVSKVAKSLRKNIYDPVLKEAQRVGLLPEDLPELQDASYINIMYNQDAIDRNPTKFRNLIAESYRQKLEEDFAEQLQRFRERQVSQEQEIEDLQVPLDEVEALRERLRKEIEGIEEGRPAKVVEIEDQIADIQLQIRSLEPTPDMHPGELEGLRKERRELRRQIRELREQAGEPLTEVRKGRKAARRRLATLSRNRFVMEQKALKKLERIDRAEELSINSLRRVVRKARSTLRDLDRISDDALDRRLSNLRDQFARTVGVFDRGEERITKELAREETDNFSKLLTFEDAQRARMDRLNGLAERLEEASSFDRQAARDVIEEGVEEVLESVNRINARRAVRQERLIEQARNLDPRLVDERIRALREGLPRDKAEFFGRFMERGVEVDPDAGTADFSLLANDIANSAVEHIRGTHLRLPHIDMLRAERGPELVRALGVESNVMEEFLENDSEILARAYLRTMAPDIEMIKRFGDVNGEQFLFQIGQNELAVADQIDARTDINAVTKERLKQRNSDLYRSMHRDLEAVIGRLRHTWGIPFDPRGWATRAARVAMNLNVLRFMGSVVPSSIPDVARGVQVYGLTRTFRDGFGQYVNGLKDLRATQREVRLLGGALDPELHTRSRQIFDVFDEVHRGTTVERGVEWATSRMGLVALFDYWTAAMKRIAGTAAIAKTLDDIDIVLRGNGTAKEIADAQQFLAASGIDGEMAERIWAQIMSAGGGGRVNGVWLPNTENWVDDDARRAFGSAVVGGIDNTIITPGVERPLWVDSTVLGRMIAQFRSFALSSTTKTMMAGLQARDAKFVTGAVLSGALGALGYWVWAVSSGGRAYEEMLDAPLERWADEAVARSGQLAILGEVQRVGERLPIAQDYVTFAGQRTTRRGGDDVVEALLGPTFDLGVSLAGVAVQLDDPTQGTVRQISNLMPWQNVFYTRYLYDKIVDEVGSSLPERRGQ